MLVIMVGSIMMMDMCVCVPAGVAASPTGMDSVSIWSVYYCNYLRLCAARAHSVSFGGASLTIYAPMCLSFH